MEGGEDDVSVLPPPLPLKAAKGREAATARDNWVMGEMAKGETEVFLVFFYVSIVLPTTTSFLRRRETFSAAATFLPASSL